jgi:hypothetical protein
MGRARLWPRRDAEAPGRGAHTKPCQPDKEAAIPPHHTCRRPRMLWQAVGVMPGFWGGGRWGKTEGAAHTKDLLDSRSLVYYSLTLTIYDVCPGRGSSVSACPDHSAYTRSCSRPMPGYPHRGGRGEETGEGKKSPGCTGAFVFRLWRHDEKGSAGHKKPPAGHTSPEGVSAHAPPGHPPTRRAYQRGGVSIAELLMARAAAP